MEQIVDKLVEAEFQHEFGGMGYADLKDDPEYGWAVDDWRDAMRDQYGRLLSTLTVDDLKALLAEREATRA